MTARVEIPKKKPNYFNVYDKKDRKFIEIKYLSQQELAEGWEQKIPSYNEKRLINHFSVTLAFLPDKFWSKLRREYKGPGEVNFKIIKDGVTRYTIIETNQDNIMMQLFEEVNKTVPNHNLLNQYIEELDVSQHTSWLVLRARHILKHNVPYFNNSVNNLDDSKVYFPNM
jgi:hypothetical protein